MGVGLGAETEVTEGTAAATGPGAAGARGELSPSGLRSPPAVCRGFPKPDLCCWVRAIPGRREKERNPAERKRVGFVGAPGGRGGQRGVRVAVVFSISLCV